MFSTAPAGVLSSGARGLPEPLRPTRRPVRQRSGLAVTEEWRPGRRRANPDYPKRGAGDPERRADDGVYAYGHLRSAPVVVYVGVRAEWEPPALRAALLDSTRSCLSDDAQARQVGQSSLLAVQKFARGAEMLRRVCEARIEISCCETLDGSREHPEDSDGSRDCSFAVRLVRQDADYGQLPAFGLYMSLRHPVSLRGWGPPGVHTSQNDCFV